MKKNETRRKSNGPRKTSSVGKIKKSTIVLLTTGYKVNLAEANGLEHLFNAVLGETLTRLKHANGTPGKYWAIIFEIGIRELYYAAGQLKRIGSHQMNCRYLERQFVAYWDRTERRINSDLPKKRGANRNDRPANREQEL